MALFESARRVVVAAALIVLALGSAGCPLPPEPTPIELVNQAPFPVRPEVFVSATAVDAAALFVAANRYTAYTTRPTGLLAPGETARFTVECGDVASLGVRQAVLFDGVTLRVWTSADQVFLRRAEDFACGDTVRFAYSLEGDVFRVRAEATAP